MSATNNDSGLKTFANFSQMSTLMEGQNTTNGWDVLCSYDLAKLNESLSQRYKQGKLVASITNVETWNWLLDFNGLILKKYDFQLSEPVLNFNTDGHATLNMPITEINSSTQELDISPIGAVSSPSKYKADTWYSVSNGTYTELPDQSKIAIGDCAMHENKWFKITTIKEATTQHKITGGISLVGSIPISAILGNNQIYNKGTVVVFKASNPTTEAHIVLHFSNKATNPATFKIEPALHNNPPQEAMLLSSICNYFSDVVDDIDYVLNTISPTPAPDGETMITPKSFVFNTVSTGDSTGVLSTYIATTQNNGQGQLDPTFTVKGLLYSPIPIGNTASMIFSQNFIQNILLANQLKKCLTSCTVTFNDIPSGIQANIIASDINVGINIPQTKTGTHTTSEGEYCTAITTSYLKVSDDVLSSNDYPVTLKISNNQISLIWQINQAGFNYETGSNTETICEGGTSNSGVAWSTNAGHKVTISIESNPNSPSQITLDSSDNINISPSLEFDQNTYHAAITPPPGHQSCWESFWNGAATTDIHGALQSALGQFAPKIKLTFDGINYFATTNILFPEGNVFEVDIEAGLEVPRDLILLGNIEVAS